MSDSVDILKKLALQVRNHLQKERIQLKELGAYLSGF